MNVCQRFSPFIRVARPIVLPLRNHLDQVGGADNKSSQFQNWPHHLLIGKVSNIDFKQRRLSLRKLFRVNTNEH